MGAHLRRLRRTVRSRGVAGTARRALALARENAYSAHEHVWYELRLREPRPRRALEPGLELVQADPSQVPLLDGLWALDRAEASRRLADGGTLWFVLDGGTPAFSCWTFRRRTPIRAVPGGWMEVPADTACLEESMTAAAARGRGVAPGAWTAIADRLADDTALHRLVTVVEAENDASRRAVEKVGFGEIGGMRTIRRAGRVRIEPFWQATDGDFLAVLRSV